jgi:hypothetical protein
MASFKDQVDKTINLAKEHNGITLERLAYTLDLSPNYALRLFNAAVQIDKDAHGSLEIIRIIESRTDEWPRKDPGLYLVNQDGLDAWATAAETEGYRYDAERDKWLKPD